MSQVFALSIHAHYRCRHSGVCCTADWDVPVELPVFRTLEAALRARFPAAAIVPGGAALDMLARDVVAQVEQPGRTRRRLDARCAGRGDFRSAAAHS